MGLRYRGRLATGQQILDTDIRDILVVERAEQKLIYAGTGSTGGISVYALTSDGTGQVFDTTYFGAQSVRPAQIALDMVAMPDEELLLVGTSSSGALLYFSLDAEGRPGAMNDISAPTGFAAWATGRAGDGSYMFYAADGEGDVAVYTLSTSLANRVAYADGEEAVPALFCTVQTATGPVLVIAAGGNAATVFSYGVDQLNSGSMPVSGRVSADDGLGFSTPTALENVSAYGQSWVFLGASGSSTLSVLRVDGAGELVLADHLLDTRETRFGALQAISAVEVQGRVIVFAAGSDEGISVFTLLPDGRLVHLQSIADTQVFGLEDITALQAARVGNNIQVFVASESAAGLGQFAWSIAALGPVLNAGNAAAGVLQGTGGDDVLLGGEGADTLIGGAGDDILVATDATAVLTGGDGADIFVLPPSRTPFHITDFVPGVDQLDLSALTFLRDPDQLLAVSRDNGILLEYRDTRVIVEARSGDPLTRADLWAGNRFAQPDRLILHQSRPASPDENAPKYLTGGDGADRIQAGGGNDTVVGGGGADRLDGGAGEDELWAGIGDDTVLGGEGKDTIGGGEGADSVEAGDGADLVWAGPGDDTVLGGGGNDALWAISGADLVRGGIGNDTLGGGLGDDTVEGGDGDDTLNGGGGADRLDGGAGEDELWAGIGDDTVLGGEGKDTIGGGEGADSVEAGDGADLVWAGPGDDTVLGGGGNDALWAISGADLVRGGIGNDTLGGGLGDDTVEGGDGDDLIYGGFGHDDLFGRGGNDVFWAGSGNDEVWGGGEDDRIAGGAGADTLYGGSGDDTLTGGSGDDSLFGAEGADMFVFSAGHGQDTITDFSPDADLLQFGGNLSFLDMTIRSGSNGTEISSVLGTIILEGTDPNQITASDFLFI